MAKKCLLCFLFLFFLIFFGYSQSDWRISGRVTDSLGTPLDLAVAYATPDSSERFLAFAYSDDKGKFQLTIPADEPAVWLHVKYLGYASFRLKVSRPVEEPLSIRLSPQENRLAEVVVSGKHPPIIQKSDTVVYHVSDFTDSTEFSVEDILKKLPGVEVQENGAVKVNGKLIEKVLVEGGDLFGKNYTLGTKNIRAHFIEKIEIIDHFQDNPVLNKVNFSEAAVLNLRLREDKKNILSGTANGGPGWGGEAKGALHANFFSISRKTKGILLSDNGNTGTQYGVEEIAATYSPSNSRDVKEKVFESPEFILPLHTDNPGLAAAFVDNGVSYFSTFRSLFEINSRWNGGLNLVFAHRKDRQVTASEQAFAFQEDIYRLDVEQRLHLNNRFYGAEAQLNYLSEKQDRSFQSYLEWGNNHAVFGQNFQEIKLEDTLDYTADRRLGKLEGFFTGLYSQKLGEQSVAQVQVKAQAIRQPERLAAENEDFSAYFGLEPNFTHLVQPLLYRQESAELLGRYLWSSGPLSLEVEPAYTRTLSSFSADWLLFGGGGDSLSLYGESNGRQTIDVHRLQAALNLAVQLSKQNRLKLMLRTAENMPKGYQARTAWAAKTELSTVFGNGAEGKVQYAYEELPPEDHWLLTFPYFSDSYLANRPFARNELLKSHRLIISYNQREPLKFRFFYLNLRATAGQHAWQEEALFFNSILELRPYLSVDNASLSLRGHLGQFFPQWKSSLTLSAASGLHKREYLLLGNIQETFNQTNLLKIAMRTTLRGRLILGLENSLQHSAIFLRENGAAERNDVLGWRINGELSYIQSQWRLSLSLDRNLEVSNSGRKARLLGARAKLSRSLLLAGKEGAIELHALNLFNTSSFGSVRNDAYFYFRSSVEAVPLFLLLKVDWSL